MKIKPFFLALIFTFISTNFLNKTYAQTALFNENPDLISPESKVNFNHLAQYLEQQNWRKANDETRNIILQATGRKSIGWIPPSEFKNLPCWDLKTIDRLWLENSNNRFGFSVQLPIYLDTGNRPGRLIGDDAYNKFGDRIGWRKDNDWIIFIENLDYSSTAPIGHFPNPRPEYSITGGRLAYSVLAERMMQCNIKK
ncbi:GUN4 domain-containing protein [Geminocystis sp. GBBB08]|uniref:GUN4 domain-containing protein n=1 Tax=Geminocystis sp. GBBB08 TaxID=2604140 RepID=UPI0027E344A5|nr:GUN4 domain-containing protein [Geminocystis sp. GBBB08]MBL1210897.1 GUN4 domain-containing protein [Geminocystis sp. GBBB08]